MPKAILPTRNEKMFAGEFTYTLTGVEMGHDGIKGLKHFIPFAQNDWKLFQSGSGHILNFVFDTVTSRLKARQEATIGASRTSTIRMRIILPEDFGSFVAVRLLSFRSAIAPDAYVLTLLKNGVADPAVTSLDINPTAALTYELKQVVPTAQYFPTDLITLDVLMTSSSNSTFADISDIEIEYETARGNV